MARNRHSGDIAWPLEPPRLNPSSTFRSSSASKASLMDISLARPGVTIRPRCVGGPVDSSNAIPSRHGICVRYSQKWLMLLKDCSTTFMKQVLPRFLSPTTFFSLVLLELRRLAGRLSALLASSECSLLRAVLGRRFLTTTSAFHRASGSLSWSPPLSRALEDGGVAGGDVLQLSSFSLCSSLRKVTRRIFSICPLEVSFTTYSSQV